MYYKARYYDPALGRFITADSIIPGASNTQAFNRYMYVVGDPVKYNDPSGHKWGSGILHKIADKITGAGNAIKNFNKYIDLKELFNPKSITKSAGKTVGDWCSDKWEKYSDKIITGALAVLVVATIVSAIVFTVLFPGAAVAIWTPVIAGVINAYMNCRDGGSFKDVLASYLIGYGIASLMPTPENASLGTCIGWGATRNGITYVATQAIYNANFGEKTEENVTLSGFVSALVIGGWMGFINAPISVGGMGGLLTLSVATFCTWVGIFDEEVIYWNERCYSEN